jgi:hypothetical protein
MIADSSFTHKVAALAEAAVDCGMGVVLGTVNAPTPQVRYPANTGEVTDTFMGVVIYEAMKEPQTSAARYAATEPLSLMRRGPIWCVTNGTMVAQGPVYLVHTGADVGKFRGNNTNATLVSGARVKTGVTGAGIAEIDFNLP